jgi:hypothetical protein
VSQESDRNPETDREAAREPVDRATTQETAPPRQEMAPEARDDRMADDGGGMAEYRTRFEQIQAQFIDEPRGAVRSAQSLVEEAVNRMMQSLQQTGATKDADTEQLRVAMKRYRDLLYQLTADTRSTPPAEHRPAP